LAGFADGDGCFLIKTRKSAAYKLGLSVNLAFILTQDIRDLDLLQSLVTYLKCGKISIATNGLTCEFRVNRLADLLNIIIPFFLKYPLEGEKRLDFVDFVKGSVILENKGHLTAEGCGKLLALKEGMNRGRK
jgi:hypothetical protein